MNGSVSTMERGVDNRAVKDLLLWPGVSELLTLLNPDGEETRLVGGCVRDALAGHPVTDIDMTTTLLPEDVSRRAVAAGYRVVPTGMSHGTVTVVVDKTPFEVTTLREDVDTDGRHAEVRFGRSFEDDARRRDFTINSLSLSLDGTIHDYCGGLEHLAERRVCFIGDAERRIREDYLRILRFFRFSARFSDSVDADGLQAVIRERAGLDGLSRERICAELYKLASGPNACEMMGIVSDTGILTQLLNGIGVLSRLRRVVEYEAHRGLAPDPVRRLAALAVLVREDAQRLRDKLRLSNDDSRRLERYARVLERLEHRREPWSAGDVRRGFAGENKLSDFALSGIMNVRAALEGQTGFALTKAAEVQWDAFARGAEGKPLFPLSGRDFLGVLKPGPEIGRMLALAREVWFEAGCPAGGDTRKELLNRTLEKQAISRNFEECRPPAGPH
ncbi:MAG: CCA tRNA nucleotidyltransferase [Methylobacteriaceae bacterium]|jgi:poly(A) polymerase|nr:CCA tRNA nucleotidyltransferase [Methylobacteriaceae bacterium]